MISQFQVERSRAIEPLFSLAPHPPQMTPRRYQHAGVEYALARNHCLIGDAPGVGKTAQGIMISNSIQANRTLVVCPASLRLNWREEIWKWSTMTNVDAHVVSKAADGISSHADYVVISYDLLRHPGLLAAILALKWDHVILDEAHALKDPQGNKRTKAICAPDMLPRVTGRFTLLSGTILPNTPRECYNATRLLDWNAIDQMSLGEFNEHYYGAGGGMVFSPVWDDKLQAKVRKVHWSEEVRNQPRYLDELQGRLRSRIMVRRLKAQVLPQLPQKQFHLVPLAITTDMRAALRHPGWARVSQLIEMEAEDFASGIGVDGAVSTVMRLLGEAKVGPACDYIEELLAEGIEKLVIAAHHTSVLKVARERLAKYGLVYMDGGTPLRHRQAGVLEFQTNPKVRIILGQTQVIGEGFTLTAAQDIVLLEPEWVPGRIEQVVDRIHRIGQTGAYVQAHLPVVPGSLDETMVATAVAKSKDIHSALDAIA
jgi:SWI/SNF-related matrix-associated actin-dependent regulator 1 of chromatin subfamily A